MKFIYLIAGVQFEQLEHHPRSRVAIKRKERKERKERRRRPISLSQPTSPLASLWYLSSIPAELNCLPGTIEGCAGPFAYPGLSDRVLRDGLQALCFTAWVAHQELDQPQLV